MSARLGCVVAITAAILWQQISAEKFCTSTWAAEPSSKKETCDIFGTPNPSALEMTCRIESTSTTNISIQWMYTDIREDAGRNGSILQNGDMQPHVRSIVVNVINGINQIAATLALKQEFTLGYYWCMVTGGAELLEYQNPSQVIQISSTCYPDIMCSDSTITTSQQLDLGRCANGDFPESIIIVDIQDTSGCSTVTPSPVDTIATGIEPTMDNKITIPVQDTSTSDTSTIPVSNTDDSASDATQATGTTDSNDGLIAGLPQGIIWVIVSLGAALLLIIILLLLVVIACLYCSKRRVKDNSTTLPHHFDNLAYQPNEPRITDSFANPESPKGLGAETELNGDHTYAAIPENYTLAAHSGEHSPITLPPGKPLTSSSSSAADAGGVYEVVDLDLASNGTGNKKHQYEVIVNEDTGISYSRLQRSGSKSHELTASMSVSGPSASPVAMSSDGACEPTTHGCETPVFDNPKYSQLSNKHGDNVRRVDSNPRGCDPQNRNEITAVNNKPLVKQKPAELNPVAGDDEYFQDSSLFIVNGLALDETRSPNVQDAAPVPSSGRYTSLQETTMAKESNYTQAIVNSDDKYISEQGHVYQVLEGSKAESASAQGKESNLGMADDTARGAVLKDEGGGEFGFVVSAPGNCARLDDEVKESGGNVSGAIYHTLVHTPTSNHRSSSGSSGSGSSSRESTPPEPAYNVVDRNPKHSTASQTSMNNGVAYNVFDRKTTNGNFNSNLPPAQYDVIDLDSTSASSKKVPPRLMEHNGYSAITKSGSISGTGIAIPGQDHDERTSSSPLPPPPSYSSLMDVGGSKQKHTCRNGDTPIYNTLEQ